MKISELELADLDDLWELSRSIETASLSLEAAKQQLTTLLARITKNVTEKEIYWVSGKSPSMAYIKEHYHILGYDNDTYTQLYQLRTDIASLEIAKARYEREFNLSLKLLDVWRTYSANKRRAMNGLEPE